MVQCQHGLLFWPLLGFPYTISLHKHFIRAQFHWQFRTAILLLIHHLIINHCYPFFCLTDGHATPATQVRDSLVGKQVGWAGVWVSEPANEQRARQASRQKWAGRKQGRQVSEQVGKQAAEQMEGAGKRSNINWESNSNCISWIWWYRLLPTEAHERFIQLFFVLTGKDWRERFQIPTSLLTPGWHFPLQNKKSKTEAPVALGMSYLELSSAYSEALLYSFCVDFETRTQFLNE